MNNYYYMKYIHRIVVGTDISLDKYIFGRLDYFYDNYDFDKGFEISNNFNYNKLFIKLERFPLRIIDYIKF